MRRILFAAVILQSMIHPALAQRGGGHVGGGHPGGMRGGFGHSGRSGGFRGSFTHRQGFRSGFGFRHFPAIYPVFYGGLGYYDSYGYSPYSDASVAYPSVQPAQPVIINQEFQMAAPAPPVMREYTPPAPTAPRQSSYEEPLYLIAFKDGLIRAVLAYWVEGTTLHTVSLDHKQEQVPLASVDRALSERLNGERNITFQLPR